MKQSTITLLAMAALTAVMAIAATTAHASPSQNAEKPYYSVDGRQYDNEHSLLMYLLSTPGHGDITQHQCVVLQEDLKFKKCTLSSRHL